jgi:hypothetical protein
MAAETRSAHWTTMSRKNDRTTRFCSASRFAQQLREQHEHGLKVVESRHAHRFERQMP